MRTMNKIEIEIDGKKVEAEKGATILATALTAGIYIPNLCAMEEMGFIPAACRLCVVEVEGLPAPVTSCTTRVQPGMVVRTRSEKVDRLVKTGFELIMSVHRLECKDCPAHKNCELQRIARERKLALKPKSFPKIEPDFPIDDSRFDFGLNPNRCVLCGKCVHVCNEVTGCRILDFTQRGMETAVSTFDGRPLSEQNCDACLKCVEVCPVGALYLIKKKT